MLTTASIETVFLAGVVLDTLNSYMLQIYTTSFFFVIVYAFYTTRIKAVVLVLDRSERKRLSLRITNKQIKDGRSHCNTKELKNEIEIRARILVSFLSFLIYININNLFIFRTCQYIVHNK